MIRRRILAVLLAVGMAISLGAFGVSGKAEAATYAYVYISFPTWMGNCPGGGSVRAINGSVTGQNTPNSWNLNEWDMGDDLIYARVALKKPNKVSVGVWCGKAARSRPGILARAAHSVSNTITPTRANQTVWVGNRGVRYN